MLERRSLKGAVLAFGLAAVVTQGVAQVGTQVGTQVGAQDQSAVPVVGIREGVIGPNDAVSISVPAFEGITKTWRVAPNGELNLPLVGTLRVGGQTVDQFEKNLTAELKTYFWDPQVTASIVDFRSRPVTIMGSVGNPGTMQLGEHKTLLDLLMAVGGPKDAGPTVTITRQADQGPIPLSEAHEEDGGKYSVATLNLNDVMAVSTPAANFIVKPNDVIAVSPAVKPAPRLVQIIGEVAKAGAIELVYHDTISIMQAIAAAGGVTHTAALGRTVVMHINPEGVRTELAQIDLSKIMEGKVKDIMLAAGDIVIVPTSLPKSYLDTVSKAMVTGAPMMLLYRF